MTFEEWLKKSSFVEPDSTIKEWLKDCWNASNIEATLRTSREIKLLTAKIKVLEKQNSDMGWQINPDRMGGGGWTEEEKSDVYGWK